MSQNRLFLLDAYALIFRAYYALIKMPRVTSGGFNTSAIFGFVNTLEELLRKENPTHIAVCFDPQGPTFRHKAYENYKGEREATPEDIKKSIPIIKDIIRAYNIPVIEVEGYEADDVIGTLSKRAEAAGFTTYMMTPDKDFGQLVSERVYQYKPGYRGQDFEIKGVEDICNRYGIERPEQVIDILSLMGDKVDNIPGCPGVGEKTAMKLIGDFGDVESLISRSDELKGALRKKIEENVEQIRFSRFLATICTEAPVEVSIESLICKEPDMEELAELFRGLEFRTLIERVRKRVGVAAVTEPVKSQPSVSMQGSLFDDICFGEEDDSAVAPREEQELKQEYKLISTEAELKEVEEAMSGVDVCGVFIVSEGEIDMSARWIGTALSIAPGKAYYIPNMVASSREMLLGILSNDKIKKISLQVKRDYVVAHNYGSKDVPIVNYYDLGVAHYLLQPEMRHSLENLASVYLHKDVSVYEDIAGPKGVKQLSKDNVAVEKLMQWACEQADVTLRLYPVISEEILNAGHEVLLTTMELPLIKVLAEMEIAGVRIDVAALNEASEKLTSRLSTIEQEIHTLAGEEFNVASPAKVGEILFVKLQLDPKAKKTKSGQYSTGEEVLEKLTHLHPIVSKVLEFRQLKKLLTTYLNALPNAINPATGKIHTNYNQTVTATGRISSSDPNLQNIPVRDDVGREIRRAFIADEGHLFLSADYSQIELRLVADFAGDEVMLESFRTGRDIHTITASKIYKIPTEDVTSTQRRNAKTANFGILYGISAFGLASRLNISRSEAKQLIDGYFATFPTVREYMSERMEYARENGYVETIKGRKRMLPDINSRNPVVRGYAERNAINAPIQGSAADIIKIAMVNIFKEMSDRCLKSRMIMQVHDELNFDVEPSELEIMQELVSRNMESAYCGRVKLTASCGVGADWLTAH